MSHRPFCEEFIATLGKGDFDTMGTMMVPDFVVREAEGLPYAGTYHGPDGWKQMCTAVAAAWAGVRLELLEVLGETADTIVLRFSLKGRGRKSGIPFETTVMELWRFRDGKLREITPYYWDTALLARVHAG